MSDQFEPIQEEFEEVQPVVEEVTVEEVASNEPTAGVWEQPTVESQATDSNPWGKVAPPNIPPSDPAGATTSQANQNATVLVIVAVILISLLACCCCSSIFSLVMFSQMSNNNYVETPEYYINEFTPDYGFEEFYFQDDSGSF
ncbi:MAG: hypothetical protein FWE87_06110 [Coriobacteriia bacterium]|nr:hypothetical protein [Coriobacteriia bacterium]